MTNYTNTIKDIKSYQKRHWRSGQTQECSAHTRKCLKVYMLNRCIYTWWQTTHMSRGTKTILYSKRKHSQPLCFTCYSNFQQQMSLVFIMPPLFIVFVFTTGVQANRTASWLPRTPARLGHYIRIKPCKLRLSMVCTHSWQMCLFRTLHNRYCSSVKDITGEICVFSGQQLGPFQA